MQTEFKNLGQSPNDDIIDSPPFLLRPVLFVGLDYFPIVAVAKQSTASLASPSPCRHLLELPIEAC